MPLPVTGMTTTGTTVATDVFYVCQPGGSPRDRKIAASELLASILSVSSLSPLSYPGWDGWVPVMDTVGEAPQLIDKKFFDSRGNKTIVFGTGESVDYDYVVEYAIQEEDEDLTIIIMPSISGNPVTINGVMKSHCLLTIINMGYGPTPNAGNPDLPYVEVIFPNMANLTSYSRYTQVFRALPAAVSYWSNIASWKNNMAGNTPEQSIYKITRLHTIEPTDATLGIAFPSLNFIKVLLGGIEVDSEQGYRMLQTNNPTAPSSNLVSRMYVNASGELMWDRGKNSSGVDLERIPLAFPIEHNISHAWNGSPTISHDIAGTPTYVFGNPVHNGVELYPLHSNGILKSATFFLNAFDKNTLSTGAWAQFFIRLFRYDQYGALIGYTDSTFFVIEEDSTTSNSSYLLTFEDTLIEAGSLILPTLFQNGAVGSGTGTFKAENALVTTQLTRATRGAY